MKPTTQSYNDGIANVYNVINTATPGKMPKKTIQLKAILNYEDRTVGMNRHFIAKSNNIKIVMLIRCQKIPMSGDEVILIDGKQYRIEQIQTPPNVEPKSMDLSLEKVGVFYDII